jgi:uncharacterized protein YcnI
MHMTRRVVVVSLAVGATMLVSTTAAWAHVEADPNRVKPGKKTTVEFAPEHGCDDSVTTRMVFRVPRAVTDAAPVEQDGWTATTEGRTITFASDQVPDEETSFGIRFTAPDRKALLSWRVVQRCQDGVERWIEGPDGEKPAPIVGVGKSPPSGEDGGH